MKNAIASAFILAASISLVSSSPAPVLPDPVDARYVCEQSSDCEVKDRGNCCGYWPVCARIDATFTKDDSCPGLNAGLCGWPAITGCGCDNGLCVAKRGGSVSVPVTGA